MRILHISTRLILGGSQENTIFSCEGQARLGHDVHLAFGPIYGPEGSLLERVQRFRTADGRAIATHTVPHMVREVRPLADWRGRAELMALIRKLRPDIVHTHSSKAGILGRAAAWSVLQEQNRERQRPGSSERPIGIVHTIHGPPFMPFDGGPMARAKTRLNNLIYTLAERAAARRCHTIISVADAMTREFLSRGIGNPEQYVTVYSGMETGPFLHAAPGQTREDVRRRLGIAPGDFVIGTVSRLAQHKGHDDLLDALGAELQRRRNWKLLWVGDGWWRERLLARVAALGLRDQAITTGLVPPESVPGMIRAMDILAHPSYREGLPRTVPQALLCAVPPVAYDVDGTREACRDYETGRLVPVGDRAALRDAILWLHDRPEERRRIAERGREECRVRFSADTMVEQLEQVYARTLSPAAHATAETPAAQVDS